jgi:hypothetical protein
MTTAAKLADSGLSIELQPEEKIAARMISVPIQLANGLRLVENDFMIWFG